MARCFLQQLDSLQEATGQLQVLDRPQRLGLRGPRRGPCHEHWLHTRPALALGLPGPHLAAVLWDLRCQPHPHLLPLSSGPTLLGPSL